MKHFQVPMFALISTILLLLGDEAVAFTSQKNIHSATPNYVQDARMVDRASRGQSMRLNMAQISEKEAKASIDKVVNALRKDKEANTELGRLVSVNNVLGFGSPVAGQVAVRFNASFKKGGMGRSAIPLPFGLGQTNEPEGRGTMVGQVKASVDETTGKVINCSVFRDLGYGRAFNLRV